MGVMEWLTGQFGGATRAGAARSGPGRQLVAHEAPRIFHHWEQEHVTPILHELGAADAPAFFAHWLRDSAARTGAVVPRFLSLGAGDGQLELALARSFVAQGLEEFTIECVEPNPLLRSQLRATALAQGLDRRVIGIAADCGDWRAGRQRYDGVMTNGALHQVMRLERVLDEVQRVLADGAWFVTRARIGRNGHQRWPEALAEVRRFWQELPQSHRWNHQLRRHEQEFADWDSARIGEGLRAQDVLRELLRRFAMPVFAGFGNLIDVFTGPAFGPNFAPGNAWDRSFVAAVHDRDEELLAARTLTPTHMFGVLSRDTEPPRIHARGLSPERCLRPA